jgi:hypothetical protein
MQLARSCPFPLLSLDISASVWPSIYLLGSSSGTTVGRFAVYSRACLDRVDSRGQATSRCICPPSPPSCLSFLSIVSFVQSL